MIELKTIRHNSPEYQAVIALRDVILRRPLGLSFSAEQLQAEADSHHLGCYVDGQLVACLLLKPTNASRVQMRQVAVVGSLQGQGLGRRLVAYSEEVAREHGFREMWLHARESAVPFYERLGYRKVGERFIEVTIPHWEMIKAL